MARQLTAVTLHTMEYLSISDSYLHVHMLSAVTSNSQPEQCPQRQGHHLFGHDDPGPGPDPGQMHLDGSLVCR